MFIDFADSANAIEYQCDICVVGSGVIGLAIASHLLAHSKCRILLVEEGGLADTENDSAVPAEFNAGDVASGVAGGRARGFGGSSRRWGGAGPAFQRLGSRLQAWHRSDGRLANQLGRTESFLSTCRQISGA